MPQKLTSQEATVFEQLASQTSLPPESEVYTKILNLHKSRSLILLPPDEVKALLLPYAQQLASNNVKTRNFSRLIYQVITRLQNFPRSLDSDADVVACQSALNGVFLARLLCQHLIELLSDEALYHTFIDSSGHVPPHSQLPVVLVRSLVDFVVDMEVSSESYPVHVEVLSFLITLTSTQMYRPLDGHCNHLFMYVMLRECPRAPELVHVLLEAIIAEAELLHSSVDATGTSGSSGERQELVYWPWRPLNLIKGVASFALFFPWHAYHWFFQQRHEEEKGRLSNRAISLLLALTHLPSFVISQQQVANPFQLALATFQDTYMADEGTDGTSGIPPGHFRLSYGQLYDALCLSLNNEKTTLLFYFLVHDNHIFLDYVMSRTDLDTLMVPLLRQLYHASEHEPEHSIMLLITLLILSQDASFNSVIHTVMLPSVPWFKERILSNISVGGLMIVVLVRTIQTAMSKLKDVYILTNCLAALANMAPHFQKLHTYAAHRIIVLFEMLSRKFQRLQAAQSRGEEDEAGELVTYTDLLRIVLEIINSAVTYALQRNTHLIYALLYHQELFEPFRQHERYVDLLDNLDQVLSFFNLRLNNISSVDTNVDDVHKIIEDSLKEWKGQNLKMFPELNFKYEEQEDPEEFFTPYVWTLVYKTTCAEIMWQDDLITIFDPSGTGDEGEDVDGQGQDGDGQQGSGTGEAYDPSQYNQVAEDAV